jgi:tetratricopeptide (TPR) repeat protein
MKATILFISLLILTGLTFAQTVEQANEFIQDKKFDKALEIANTFLSKDSTDQAIRIFSEITDQDSTNKNAYIGLGDAYNKMGVGVLALTNYEHAEKLDSLDIPLKFKIADVLYKQQEYTAAANIYLKVISIDSTNEEAYFKVGQLLYYAKQYPNAAFYLTKYIKLNKKNEKAFFFAANAFYVMNNFSNSVKMAEEGLQNFPDMIDLKKLAALSLVYDKKYDESLNYFNQVPDSLFSAKDFARVGMILQNGQQDSLAIIFMTKALKKDSTLTYLYENVANMYLTEGHYEQALPYYSKKIQLDSANAVSSYVNESLCYIPLKDYNNARISLLNALKIKSDYTFAILWLARTYRYMDSSDAAVDTYKKLIDVVKPDTTQENKKLLGEAYSTIGVTYLVKKKYPPAIEPLKEAINYEPDNSQYHLWLAQAYALTTKTKEAVKEYKKVLALDPKNADAKKGLKILGE